jgi:hypothetical protein
MQTTDSSGGEAGANQQTPNGQPGRHSAVLTQIYSFPMKKATGFLWTTRIPLKRQFEKFSMLIEKQYTGIRS